MNLDPTTADVRFAAHNARVGYADRFGAHLSATASVTPRRRTPPVLRTAILAFPRLIGAALRGLDALTIDSRDGLRSQEHELARIGIAWQSDAENDRVLADQLRAARETRLTSPVTMHDRTFRPARRKGLAIGVAPEFFTRRLSLIRHTAATEGLTPLGD
jgi:hypothetical protein